MGSTVVPTARCRVSVTEGGSRRSQEIYKAAHMRLGAAKGHMGQAHPLIGGLQSGCRSLMVCLEVHQQQAAVEVYTRHTNRLCKFS